jgi:predicted Co/Zn/Cd cation transporter (cation efflux family)
MRTKAITIVCAAAIGLATTTPAFASLERDPAVVAADALVMRPLLFASTVAGSAIFLVCLPMAAISKSVKSTAHALVVTPAEATFTRPLGDFDYYEQDPVEKEMATTN